MKKLFLNGQNLSIENVVLAARGYDKDDDHLYPKIELSSEISDLLKEFRKALEDRMAAGDIIYGVNTGCGIKKATIIPDEEIVAYQRHYIPAHCVAIGNYLPEEVTRAAMLLRLNSFTFGNSGVRLELCEKIIEFYNAGIIPCVPEKGSVGSSGDLALLAHVAAALTGIPDQEVYYRGEIRPILEVLKETGITAIELAAKEAMAITNGSTFTLALALLAYYDAIVVIKTADIAAALSLEAVRGEAAAFDVRIHAVRKHNGSINCAANMRKLFKGSKRMTNKARDICLNAERKLKKYDKHGQPLPRVQDAYSFRAHAQVMGSVYEALDFCGNVFLREVNAATDNPLIFAEEDGFTTISGGNFHGEPLAQAADFLKIALQQLANISERRLYALTMASTSYGLPDDLMGLSNPDLNTGLMIMQYSAASLVSENKILCHPSVIDSIPTSANQEDYVSMGTTAARFLKEVVKNVQYIVAMELIGAAQGIHWTIPELGQCAQLGEGTALAYDFVRKFVDPMDDDRYIRTDIEKIVKIIEDGSLSDYVYSA